MMTNKTNEKPFWEQQDIKLSNRNLERGSYWIEEGGIKPASGIKPHFLVLLATCLVAGSFLASGKLAPIVNPFSLTLLRFLGAALFLAPVVIYKKEWRVKILPTMPRAMIIGFFYSAFFIGFFESLKTTTPLNTGTLYTLVPLMTALLSAIFIKDRIKSRQIFVYITGAMGTVWVIFDGQVALLLSLSLNKGDFIFLLAAFSMCCYSISMKLLYRDDEMIVLVFCTLISGVFWITLALLITNQPLQWNLIRGNSLFHMSYLIVGATVATTYLYQRTTIMLGPSRVNAYIFLNPALITLLLLVVEGVPMSAAIIPGVILSSMATIILQSLNGIRNKPNPHFSHGSYYVNVFDHT